MGNTQSFQSLSWSFRIDSINLYKLHLSKNFNFCSSIWVMFTLIPLIHNHTNSKNQASLFHTVVAQHCVNTHRPITIARSSNMAARLPRHYRQWLESAWQGLPTRGRSFNAWFPIIPSVSDTPLARPPLCRVSLVNASPPYGLSRPNFPRPSPSSVIQAIVASERSHQISEVNLLSNPS